MDDLDAAQPRGRDEAGQIGHRSPAEADHGVGAGEVGLAEDLPAEGGDLDALALLGVGDLGEEHFAVGGERRPQLFGLRLRVGGWMMSTFRAAGGRAAPSPPSMPRPTVMS